MLSLHGLVRHMAEVERNWFRRVLGGEDAEPLYYDDASRRRLRAPRRRRLERRPRHLAGGVRPARALEAAAPSLDTTGTRRGEPVSLRWIMLHMIEEYARHNGHADLIREMVDGTTGD